MTTQHFHAAAVQRFGTAHGLSGGDVIYMMELGILRYENDVVSLPDGADLKSCIAAFLAILRIRGQLHDHMSRWTLLDLV